MNILTIVSLQYQHTQYNVLFCNQQYLIDGSPDWDESDVINIDDYILGAQALADKVDMIDLDAQSSIQYFSDGMLEEEKLQRSVVQWNLGVE